MVKARFMILVLFFLLSPAAALSQDAPLAVLMGQQGEVTVVRGSASLAGEFGMHLGLGDEIRTGTASRADILFATGQSLQLGANGTLVVQSTTDSEGESSRPGLFASADRLLTLKDDRGTSAIGRVRGGDSAEIIAVSPRKAARVTRRPVFRWNGGEGEVEVTLESEGAIVWQGTVVDAQSLDYPADAPALEEGRTYAWRVKTADPLALSAAESQTAFFETLTSVDEGALDATVSNLAQSELAESTRAVMVAGVLFESGLIDEALDVIDRAVETGDNAEGLRAVRESLRAAMWP